YLHRSLLISSFMCSALSCSLSSFFFSRYGDHRDLHSFPTRRSSDLLPALGFSDENLQRYRDCIRQPYGMILHCGPTGSGKSMTLDRKSTRLNSSHVAISYAVFCLKKKKKQKNKHEIKIKHQ